MVNAQIQKIFYGCVGLLHVLSWLTGSENVHPSSLHPATFPGGHPLSLTQQNGEPPFMPTLHDLEFSFPFQSYLFGFEDMMLFLVRIHSVPCPVP